MTTLQGSWEGYQIERNLRWVRAHAASWKQYVILFNFAFDWPGSKLDVE